jgi:hypothetical protein
MNHTCHGGIAAIHRPSALAVHTGVDIAGYRALPCPSHRMRHARSTGEYTDVLANVRSAP